MARTYTTAVPLGFKAPDFILPNVVTGKLDSLRELAGQQATVVMFICNHCPFVIHILDELVAVAKEFGSNDITFIAISSNDIKKYHQDGPEKMKELAISADFSFPYLFDESQEIAKAYSAACTPDISVFDDRLLCIYRGQFDDSRPGNKAPINGADLRKVLSYVLDSKALNFVQKPSLGCNIKWKE